jgi:hypothetical protein
VQTTLPIGKPETTRVIENVSEKNIPNPLFWGVEGGRGRGERGALKLPRLICQHPIYMMTDKTRSNPNRVVTSLKNAKQTNQGYPTGMLDYLRNTRSLARREQSL